MGKANRSKTEKKTVKKKTEKKKSVIETLPIPPSEAKPPNLNEVPIKEFKDPRSMTLAALEKNMKDLVQTDTNVEVELSANIAAFWDRNEHEKMGYEWHEYLRNVIGISPSKADALRDNWKALDGLVKLPESIVGLAWSKLRTLIPAIKVLLITKDTIKEWLAHCTIGGPKSLSVETLATMIRDLMGKAAKAGMDDKLKTVTFKVPAYEIDSLNQFTDIAKSVLKTEDNGTCYLTAALEFSANHAHVTDAQAWKARGLASLKETAERIAPVVALYVPTDPLATKEVLGVQPLTQIYQGFGDQKTENERGILVCIASSEKEAKQFLGVETVRVFPIRLAPSIVPKVPFSMAAPAATPKQETIVKAAKKKARGPNKGAPVAELTPAPAPIPTLTEQQTQIKAMSADKIKAAVKGLVDERVGGIGRTEYSDKLAAFKACPVPGLTPGQSVLDWLMGLKKK
jgi:hypothetical protein